MNARTIVLSFLLAVCGCDSKSTTNDTRAPEPGGESAAAGDAEALPDRDSALAHRLVEEEGGVLLDVRTTEEFDAEHIEGAANISHDELSDRMAEVEKLAGGDKSKPIVVYCRSGNRAGQAKKILLEAGYKRVTNLGGLSDW